MRRQRRTRVTPAVVSLVGLRRLGRSLDCAQSQAVELRDGIDAGHRSIGPWRGQGGKGEARLRDARLQGVDLELREAAYRQNSRVGRAFRRGNEQLFGSF